jgi:hypothetical protein
MLADLNEPCPDEFCGNIIDGVSNALAPNTPWPTKVLDFQCNWFPCDDITDCEGVDSSVSTFADQCGGTFTDFDAVTPREAPAEAPSASATGQLSPIGGFAVAFVSFSML